MPRILFFPFYGPSRRSDKRVVEVRLDFADDPGSGFPGRPEEIRQKLLGAGILAEGETFPLLPLPEKRMDWYASLLAQTALLLQRKNGHRVDYVDVSCDSENKRCIALVEHEHSEVGMAAVKIAVGIFMGNMQNPAQQYRVFCGFASERALPFETAAIIRAARQRDIPCMQLEREPLAGKMSFAFRVRRNGLLSLGHGSGTRILDGTFYLDRADDQLKALLRSADQRAAFIRETGFSLLQDEVRDNGVSSLFHLLVVNGKVTALADAAGSGRQLAGNVHEQFIECARTISRKLAFPPLVVTLRATDISLPMAQADAAVIDFEIAPDLYELLSPCDGEPGLLDAVAGDLVEGLFPDGAGAQIPVVAVTGTNGKTTTAHMLNCILQSAGYRSGLVNTDGIFLDNKPVSHGDASAFIGHARVLGSKLVDAAVLEAHHRGMAIRGFAFQHCDVAICLNVTEEHLAEGEIETIEEMVEIKRSLLERAQDGAVLNADDPNCLSMIPFMTASRTGLYSSTRNRDELAEHGTGQDLFCVVEPHDGEDHVVLYDGGQRQVLLAVSAMPCTFGGAARFNLENALAAMTAAYLLGVATTHLCTAMESFRMGFEHTPGRLNLYHDLPYSAVMDFAHNPDGLARLAEFTSGLDVQGRRLLLISCAGDRTDGTIAEMARVAAGKFDHYVCRSYPNTRGRAPQEVPEILQAALMAAGVVETAIDVVPHAGTAIERILDMAGASDLVVLPSSRKEFQTLHQRFVATQSALKQDARA